MVWITQILDGPVFRGWVTSFVEETLENTNTKNRPVRIRSRREIQQGAGGVREKRERGKNQFPLRLNLCRPSLVTCRETRLQE